MPLIDHAPTGPDSCRMGRWGIIGAVIAAGALTGAGCCLDNSGGAAATGSSSAGSESTTGQAPDAGKVGCDGVYCAPGFECDPASGACLCGGASCVGACDADAGFCLATCDPQGGPHRSSAAMGTPSRCRRACLDSHTSRTFKRLAGSLPSPGRA